ncbi:unnamed protein product [Symbiodinium sp. CCMP2592]|nr:unnamed protein product [Symbiodinium sp. CCMP2592]
MPPKKGANDQPSTKGGAGKGKDRTEAQVTRVDFGLPSSMVQTLQSISSRATQDLWGQGSFTTDGATVEQLARRTANTLGRLSKRLNGNMRAKKDLQDALTAWVSMLSQHLLGLTHRVDALSRKVDEDTIAAAEELRHVSAAQPSATTNEQLARAEQSLGPVWTDPQVQEVHRLAAALKAFATTNPSSLDMHPGPGGSVALVPRGTLGAPLQPATAMSATLMPPVPLGPPAAHPGGFGSGGSEASFGTPERSTGVGESEARSGRWRKRSGGGGLHGRGNLQAVHRRHLRELRSLWWQTKLLPGALAASAGPWVEAWMAMLRFCVDSGSDMVGDVAQCPQQDACLPLTLDAQAQDATLQTAESTWMALVNAVSDPTQADLQELHRLLQTALHCLRKCTDVLPRVRQGLLVASLLTTGGLLDPFSFAPSTAQEWLFPSLLLEAEVQLRGFVARDASQDPRVQVLLRLPSPFLGAALAEELDKELECGVKSPLSLTTLSLFLGRCLILCIALYRVAVVSERFLATYGPQLSWRRSWQLSCTLSATAWWVAALFGPPTSMFACACISELLAFLPGLALDLGSTRLGHLCTCACPGGFASRCRSLLHRPCMWRKPLWLSFVTRWVTLCLSGVEDTWSCTRNGTPCRRVGSSRCKSRSGARVSGCRRLGTALFLGYLSVVDGSTLHLGVLLAASCSRFPEAVQLHAHGFHEGRPVLSTGPVLPTPSVDAMCEVYPVGRTGNLLLPRTDRNRRHLAVFVGTPPGAPVLEPCPVPFLVDEWLHGPLLHARLSASLGFMANTFSVCPIRGVLPGLPGEQLLLSPVTCTWRQVWLPVDLRQLGGRVCMLLCSRDSTCRSIAQLAMTAQEVRADLDRLLARCQWGWLTLTSQPLFLQDVDTLQFQIGPAPESLQGPVGASLDPPISLFSAMQVSLPTYPTGPEVFHGRSHNQAVLITPNGLVYVEAPVFADAATFRRIVATQASPHATGGTMRIWQPLPSLPLVQFLEVHCIGDEVPCILDFRPVGWRLTTVCVVPPVTAVAAIGAASRRERNCIPLEWVEQCSRGGFGLLHRELVVLPDQVLTGNFPLVLMFFPHVFRQDSSSSSEEQVGGWDEPDASGATDTVISMQHTLLPSPARSQTATAMPACTGISPAAFLDPPAALLETPAPQADATPGSAFDDDPAPSHARPRRLCFSSLLLVLAHGGALSMPCCARSYILIALLGFVPSCTVHLHSEPASPREVVVSAARATDRRVAAPASIHASLQAVWLQEGDFGEGPLWKSLPVQERGYLITCRLWSPGTSVRLEFSGLGSAREAAAEIYRQAIRLGRPQVVAASAGPTSDAINLVTLPQHPRMLTVLFDAGSQVVCAELPSDYTAAQVLRIAQQAAEAEEVQILKGFAHRLRHGDVVRIAAGATARTLDVSAFVLPSDSETASRWLQTSRLVSILHPSDGVLTFEVPRSADLTTPLLRALLGTSIPGKHVFLEVPGADALPHSTFAAVRPGQDCIIYRLTDVHDPSAVGLFMAFAGVFSSFPVTLPDGCLQLRRDFARPCTMSWTHELSRQTYGFAVASPHLGAYIARTCPSSEVQMHLWLPGQGPIHLRVAVQHLGAHLGAYLGGFLPACEYGLHVAFDSNPQVLDLIIAPPGAAAWWIVKDTIGCELLRPVVQHYVSHCSFFFCAIEPDGAVYSVEPSAEVRFMTPSPHGARALVAKVLPGLVGRVVDGVLQVVAAKAGSMSLAGGLALLLLSGQAASMQTVPELPLVPAVAPPALPAITRIWTLNVRQPVDLPWRAEGYPTRWLRDLMRRLHSIDDPGEFRSTCGPRDSGVQHVLFVPLVPPTVPRNRFWLLHWGEAAVVAFGHTPFSWDVVSAHLRTLFPGGQVPDRCPAIAYAGAFYPPGAALPDLPSGAIIQLLTGALARVPSEDDPWHPEPYVVDGPWFQHVPSKGPALEPAILIDAGGSRRPDGYVPTTLVDQGTQTNLGQRYRSRSCHSF